MGSGNPVLAAVKAPRVARPLRATALKTSMTGCAAHGRSSQVRSFASRTRQVRRPHPPQAWPRTPRRSIRIHSRGCAPSMSNVTCCTRYPSSPSILVHSARDPTRSSLVYSRQEKTPSDGPMASGIALLFETGLAARLPSSGGPVLRALRMPATRPV